MIFVLVGHRGVGKTTLIKKIAQENIELNTKLLTYDLDNYIEIQEKQTIETLVTQDQNYFRQLELKWFNHLLTKIKNNNTSCYAFISVGAGINIEKIPRGPKIIWIKRDSDKNGRIFLNRPRLTDKDDLDEFSHLYKIRTPNYRKYSHLCLNLLEGYGHNFQFELIQIFEKSYKLNLDYTLTSKDISNKEHWNFFKNTFQHKGIRFLELRDDLLSNEEINKVIRSWPTDHLLYSFRNINNISEGLKTIKSIKYFDWSYELEKVFPWSQDFTPNIVSIHEFDSKLSLKENLKDLIFKFPNSIIKAAPLIYDFKALQEGHQWFIQNPSKHIFLPRSQNGRWKWYRNILMDDSFLNFVRMCSDTYLDQPTITEKLFHDDSKENKLTSPKAAIIGNPVAHSWTPTEHSHFFHQYGVSIYKIPCDIKELNKNLLFFLKSLNFKYFAVTSPLKKEMIKYCDYLHPRAAKYQSLNTMIWNDQLNRWEGENTDYFGLQKIFSFCDFKNDIVVWGSGGTMSLIQEILPQAQIFSAQTGRIKGKVLNQMSNPNTLIWAGRNNASLEKIPKNWSPSIIIDLNYTDNSLGRILSKKFNAQYISGEVMFKEQAHYQRHFWQSYLSTNSKTP